jgi:hypothetical protein
MEPDADPNAPDELPADEDAERRRLLADAARNGVDADEALELAERVSRLEPLPDALRAVDRRIASGYSLEDAREILLDDVPNPSDDDRA